MFPSTSRDFLLSVYLSCGSDFQRCIDRLTESLDAESAGKSIKLAATAKRDYFSSLPPDLLLAISESLDLTSLLALNLVSHHFGVHLISAFDGVRSLAIHSLKKFSQHLPSLSPSTAPPSSSPFCSDKTFLAAIRRFPGVQRVSFRNSPFSSFSRLREVFFGSQIESLDFTNCAHMNDEELQTVLGACEHIPLHSLNLSGCTVTDEGVEILSTHPVTPQLTRLTICKNPYVTKTGLRILLNCARNLQVLELNNTNVRVDDSFFPRPTEEYPIQLRSLSLSSCRRLAANFTLQSKFCALEEINLSSNIQLHSITLRLSRLRSLNFSNCKYLKESLIDCPELESLNASGCTHLVALDYQAPHSQLHELNLNLCRELRDQDLRTLLSRCANSIQVLQLRGCGEIIQETVETVGSLHLWSMKTVELSGCKRIAKEFIEEIERHRQRGFHQIQSQ